MKTYVSALIVMLAIPAAALAAPLDHWAVVSTVNSSIVLYDGDTLAHQLTISTGMGVGEAAYGPDGYIYVTNPGNGGKILRYALDGTPMPSAGRSGAEVLNSNDAFASTYSEMGSNITAGPDGRMYFTGSNHANGVWSFDPADPLGTLTQELGGYSGDVVFGPDVTGDGVGDLFLGTNNSIDVYDFANGVFPDIDGAGPKAAGDYITTEGSNVVFIGNYAYWTPGAQNLIYISDLLTGDPVDWDGAGGYDPGIFRDDDGDPTDGMNEYNKAGALAVGFDGMLYMPERFASRIWKIDPATGAQSVGLSGAANTINFFVEVPEPATLALLAAGSLALLRRRRR